MLIRLVTDLREDDEMKTELFEQMQTTWMEDSVTRLGDLIDFGQLLKVFGNN